MNLLKHFIISLVLAALAYPFFGWQSIFIFIGGFFVDVDHMLLYTLRKRKISIRGTYDYITKNDLSGKKVICIFHTIEFWIILIIFSFYSKIIFAFSIGVFSHMLCDLIHEFLHFDKGIDARTYSFYSRTLYLKRKKRLTFWNIFKD